jgi:hypothetical protein
MASGNNLAFRIRHYQMGCDYLPGVSSKRVYVVFPLGVGFAHVRRINTGLVNDDGARDLVLGRAGIRAGYRLLRNYMVFGQFVNDFAGYTLKHKFYGSYFFDCGGWRAEAGVAVVR